MALEQIAPASVTELAGALGRADDVGEEHGGEHALRLGRLTHAREELPDLVEDVVAVVPGNVVCTRKLDVLRFLEVASEPPRVLDMADLVLGAMDDQCRRIHSG